MFLDRKYANDYPELADARQWCLSFREGPKSDRRTRRRATGIQTKSLTERQEHRVRLCQSVSWPK